MSMSSHVSGFRPPDEKWRKMKAVWDASEEAGVSPPEEVRKFFNGESPDEAGVVVKLSKDAVKEYNAEMQNGFEVDISKLPKDVKIIRFVNSY